MNYYEKTDKILALFPEKTFNSANASKISSTAKNLKRVQKAVEALSELSSWNMKADSRHFFESLKMAVIDYMGACGYDYSFDRRDIFFKKGDAK